MEILLRLHSVRQDDVGWTATFFGKPDIHGNSISVPVSELEAAVLQIGKQYLFTETSGFDWTATPFTAPPLEEIGKTAPRDDEQRSVLVVDRRERPVKGPTFSFFAVGAGFVCGVELIAGKYEKLWVGVPLLVLLVLAAALRGEWRYWWR